MPEREDVCIICGKRRDFRPPPPPPKSEDSSFCSGCGKCQSWDNEFCVECGARMPRSADTGVSEAETPSEAPKRGIFCFHCHTAIPSGGDSCPKCGRLVAQVVPQYGYSRSQYAALIGAILLLAALIGCAVWLGVTHYAETQRLAAIREAQAEQRRIHRELYTLQTQNPLAKFALYPGNGRSVAINTRLSTCQVRRVDFARSGDTLDVNVDLLGIKSEGQAPVVNVAVYDEQGNLLSRSAIVKFTFANLGQGEVRDVDDRMDVPSDGMPVFMSIDESDS